MTVISLKTGQPVPPDFIDRGDISAMTDEQLDEMLQAIRVRRMKSFIIYQQSEDEREAITVEKAKVAIEKNLGAIIKTLNALDKNYEKLETQVNKLRGLRIQAGLSVM